MNPSGFAPFSFGTRVKIQPSPNERPPPTTMMEMSTAPEFPITPLLPEIVATLETTPRLVLEAPPGAGKTTQVPLALLQAPWMQGRILMLEPRRIAARSAAMFLAAQLGEEVGEGDSCFRNRAHDMSSHLTLA